MKKMFLFATIIYGGLFLSSCSSMYIPSMANAPLLGEQGEIQGELSLTTNAVQLGADYAITEHVAVMGETNISYGNFTDSYDIYTKKSEFNEANSLNWGRFINRYYEIGAGYYNICNSEHFKLEGFGGLGFCHATDENKRSEKVSSYDSKYTLLFAQVNTGFTSKYFDAGLGFRVAPTFHSFKWDENYYEDASKNHNGTEHFAMWHFEPLIFIRAGYDHIKFTAKAGMSLPSYTQAYYDAYHNIPGMLYTKATLMHFSIGACFTFNNAK
ncbi:MAG: hypothetical protein MJ198_09315 [Bacteroidales bacterium]|nr:hypothetical protein [Bacteroidales bacterium]